MKAAIIIVLFVLSGTLNTSAQKITPADLKLLKGKWEGTLTYQDYTSNKPYVMPAKVTFHQSSTNPNVFLRSFEYSNEPKANHKDSIIISQKGTMLDEYKIISNKKLKNGSTEIIGEKKGVDGNDDKPATIRFTFVFSATAFIDRKDVLFDGEREWIKRNVYTFHR